MRRNATELLLLLAAAGAAAAAVLAALVGTDAALAVLGASLAVGFVGLAWTARRVLRRLDQLDTVARSTHRLASSTRGVKRRQDRTAQRLGRVARSTEALRAQVAADAKRTHTGIDAVASDAVRLARLVERIAPGAAALPGLAGWAVTPSTLLEMTDEIDRRSGPLTIVECGSGSSTLFFALLLRQRGQGGQVFALESSTQYAEETREHLRRLGVAEHATVVDAPLVRQPMPDGTSQRWFDLAALPDVGSIDLLFVDGPVGWAAKQARYPAVPMLGARLAPGAWVVLDDTHRPAEQAIVERWLTEDHGASLSRHRENGRSTMLRVS